MGDVLDLAREAGATLKEGILDRMVRHLPKSALRRLGIFAHGEDTISIHRDEPVFDGQYSNRCYQDAVRDAFVDFQRRAERSGRYSHDADERFTEQWDRIIMHLPYAFQAKRMFPAVFHRDRAGTAMWPAVEAIVGPAPERGDSMDEDAWHATMDAYRRAISKTEAYTTFHRERIEKGQRASSLIGNQYTGSIFLALMSTFESDLEDNTDLDGTRFGLCGYGSGAKAKVFEGVVDPRWREVVSRWNLFERLAGRVAIDAAVYEELHKGVRERSVVPPTDEFVRSEEAEDDLEGARRYSWISA